MSNTSENQYVELEEASNSMVDKALAIIAMLGGILIMKAMLKKEKEDLAQNFGMVAEGLDLFYEETEKAKQNEILKSMQGPLKASQMILNPYKSVPMVASVIRHLAGMSKDAAWYVTKNTVKTIVKPPLLTLEAIGFGAAVAVIGVAAGVTIPPVVGVVEAVEVGMGDKSVKDALVNSLKGVAVGASAATLGVGVGAGAIALSPVFGMAQFIATGGKAIVKAPSAVKNNIKHRVNKLYTRALEIERDASNKKGQSRNGRG